MKNNCFRMFNRLFFTAFFLSFWLSATVAAQPGGCSDFLGFDSRPSCRAKNLAYLQAVKNDLTKSDQAVVSEPKNAENYAVRGAIYSKLYARFGSIFKFEDAIYFTETDGKAINDFSKAVALAPNRAKYYAERGKVYQNQWEKLFAATISLGKKSPKFQEYFELTYTKSVEFDAAVRDFRRAVELASDYAEKEAFLYGLWMLYANHAASLLDLTRNESGVELTNISKAYDIKSHIYNDYEKIKATAFDHLQKTAKTDEDSLRREKRLRTYVGGFYISAGDAALIFRDWQKAADYYEEAVEYIEPDDLYFCGLYNRRAGLQLMSNNAAGAVESFEFAFAEQPNCAFLRSNSGAAYLAKGDYRKAVADFTASIVYYEGGLISIPAYLGRGKAYLRLGDYEKALADFQIMKDRLYVDYCPQNYLLIAESYRGLGDREKAEEAEQTVRQLAETANLTGVNPHCPNEFERPAFKQILGIF